MPRRLDLGAAILPQVQVRLNRHRASRRPAIERAHILDAGLVTLQFGQDGEDGRAFDLVDPVRPVESGAGLAKPGGNVGHRYGAASITVFLDDFLAVLAKTVAIRR